MKDVNAEGDMKMNEKCDNLAEGDKENAKDLLGRGEGVERELSHIDKNGNARMVDVSEKEVTTRIAVAEGCIEMLPETLNRIKTGGIKKGDVLAVASVAGVNAAKHTWESIPMCHNIALSGCEMGFETVSDTTLKVSAKTVATALTGVEMEALCAVATACLTVYDMCKAIDRGMEIKNIRLVKKSGGKSGTFERK